MSSLSSFNGTGRRKRSSASVFIKINESGQPNIMVNRKPAKDYFTESFALESISQPLKVLGIEDAFDIAIKVKGGGKSGQRDASRLGVAKALLKFETLGGELVKKIKSRSKVEQSEEISFHRILRQGKFTTTDARRVERKLYGLHKSRKRATYVRR